MLALVRGKVLHQAFGFGFGHGDSGNNAVTGFVAVLIPYWFPAPLFAVLPARWFVLKGRARRRSRIGLCPRCGYDLRATPGRCPECGREVLTTEITENTEKAER